jgi:hypothetical protein
MTIEIEEADAGQIFEKGFLNLYMGIARKIVTMACMVMDRAGVDSRDRAEMWSEINSYHHEQNYFEFALRIIRKWIEVEDDH